MTVNLRTGEYYDARKEDYCTKIAAVAPETMEIPKWHAFLDKITGGRHSTCRRYLQRMAGYCMTGITDEHVLFFLYGTGANGKCVFINTLTGIWGDYAAIAPMRPSWRATPTSTRPTSPCCTASAGRRPGNRGSAGIGPKPDQVDHRRRPDHRPVHAQRFLHLHAAVQARHRRQPQAGTAQRRRSHPQPIHLVPFTVTIPPEERDKELFDEAASPNGPASCSGPSTAASNGSKSASRHRRPSPDATDEYLAEEDAIARWIDECCVAGKNLWGIGARLWGSWKAGRRPTTNGPALGNPSPRRSGSAALSQREASWCGGIAASTLGSIRRVSTTMPETERQTAMTRVPGDSLLYPSRAGVANLGTCHACHNLHTPLILFIFTIHKILLRFGKGVPDF